MEAPYVGRTRLPDANPDVWLYKQKIESGLQILTYSAWSFGPVDRPPLDNAFDPASSASRDEKFKRHSYP